MLKTQVSRTFASVIVGVGMSFAAGTSLAACTNYYVVKQGDTLGAIASEQLGDFNAKTRLHDLNRDVMGNSEHRLAIGQILKLPCSEPAYVESASTGALISPAALSEMQGTDTALQVLDIRSSDSLSTGLVPGSISVPYSWFHQGSDNAAGPPSAEALSRTLGMAGVDLTKKTVVVNHDNTPVDAGQSAYVYWLLKSAGVADIAVLDGGFEAWGTSDLPTVQRSAPVRPSPLSVRYSNTWWATKLDVYALASTQVPGTLLDTRPEAYVQSVSATAPVDGDLPFAQVSKVMSSDLSIQEGVEIVTKSVSDQGVLLNKDLVVSFGMTAEAAALSWFYLSEVAGIRNVRLYPESADGWEDAGGILHHVKQTVQQ